MRVLFIGRRRCIVDVGEKVNLDKSEEIVKDLSESLNEKEKKLYLPYFNSLIEETRANLERIKPPPKTEEQITLQYKLYLKNLQIKGKI